MPRNLVCRLHHCCSRMYVSDACCPHCATSHCFGKPEGRTDLEHVVFVRRPRTEQQNDLYNKIRPDRLVSSVSGGGISFCCRHCTKSSSVCVREVGWFRSQPVALMKAYEMIQTEGSQENVCVPRGLVLVLERSRRRSSAREVRGQRWEGPKSEQPAQNERPQVTVLSSFLGIDSRYIESVDCSGPE